MYLSIGQSAYGVGATISPLIATGFVGADISWHFFYLVLLGCMMVSSIMIFISFSGSEIDMAPWENDGSEDIPNDHKVKLKAALQTKATWLFAVFVFVYQGAEVSMGGWIVTYLLDYRNGGHVVGYVASGFWGGVALGRFILVRPLHKHLGSRRSVIVCSLMSLLFVTLTWVISNVVAAGVFVSLAGFFVGPNYPIMVTLASEMLPRKIQVISLTIASAFGSAGGAFFPFLVGLLSQQVGAFVIMPMFIVLYCVMLLLWICLPNRERRLRTTVTNDLFSALKAFSGLIR
ncbi:hypothetical protein PSN45_005338 [Yamadazyma tenuis]|uniref:uncharacterized protein n=1 Tax=Candida tenuis TaxID=2315449 RepID=UPI00279B2CC1|nr:hypothetical protein PSN45_005338 [Yamadazyma tenuis]